jgi:DNA-binding transcriptional ArsR family regulator
MFASSFVTVFLAALVLQLLYCLRCIYILYFEQKIYWTRRKIDWTKARSNLLGLPRRELGACKAAISAGGRFLGGSCRDISGAYLGRGRRVVAAAISTLGLPAVLWSGRTSRQGRGTVPQAAATGRLHLKPAQQRAVEALASSDSAELTRGQYQEIAGVSRSQAAYDLAALVEAGVLERLGGGRATRYRPVRKSQAGQRHWTSERIRAELAEFCGDAREWPSAGAFKAAGRTDLYVAASRYGGIGFWAVELGYPRPGRAASARPPETPLGRKLAWAGAGALASAALVAAAAAVVVLSLPRESTRTVGSPRVSPPATVDGRVSDESSHAVRKSRTPATQVPKKKVRRAHPSVSRHVERVREQPATGSSAATLITYRTYSRPSSSGSSAQHVSTPTTPVPTTSGGPTPLRAPLTASAPTPLKPPR